MSSLHLKPVNKKRWMWERSGQKKLKKKNSNLSLLCFHQWALEGRQQRTGRFLISFWDPGIQDKCRYHVAIHELRILLMLLGPGFEMQRPKSVPGLRSNFWVFPADVCFRLDSIASIGPHSDATQSRWLWYLCFQIQVRKVTMWRSFLQFLWHRVRRYGGNLRHNVAIILFDD